MKVKVLIVGGGPAGLFAAYRLASKGISVALLEKNHQFGRKLLLSGSGQCNITADVSLAEYSKAYGNGGTFLKHALKRFGPKESMAFFEANGVPMWVREDGKVFPKSLMASDVVNCLVKLCARYHVQMMPDTAVTDISHDEERFVIQTNHGAVFAEILILATGGCSYPHTGSSGEALQWIKAFGHKVVEPRPALTPVYIDDFALSELKGLSFKDVQIEVIRKGQTLKKYTGDLLITHFGFSGPVIINHSRDLISGDILSLNFLGGVNPKDVKDSFTSYLKGNKTPSLKAFMHRYGLPKRLVEAALIQAGIDEAMSLHTLTKSQKDDFFDALFKARFRIGRLGDFKVAMATAGGVSLEEVSSKTMASTHVRHLYFIGEVLDIDGDTGGFNIQAAFSTAYLASEDISTLASNGSF